MFLALETDERERERGTLLCFPLRQVSAPLSCATLDLAVVQVGGEAEFELPVGLIIKSVHFSVSSVTRILELWSQPLRSVPSPDGLFNFS